MILSGRYRGNIKASGRVELRAPADVDGTIETPALSVEEGVALNGTITMKRAGDAKPEEGSKKS